MEEALSGLLARLRGPQAGVAGEDAACRHLEKKGYRILARNFRCRSGEIDIIARDGDITVFVEVKDRHGRSHGEGHESVTVGKRLRVVRAARLFAAARGLLESPTRFDVISIEHEGDAVRLRHDEGAFDSDGR